MSSDQPGPNADDVEAAASRISGAVSQTQVQRNARLSELSGHEVWLKREDLQAARSYKARGAFNLIAQLDKTQAAAGVVCASAGNHAQGVAHACATLGVNARIYLPRPTPRQKRQRVEAIGGTWVEPIIAGAYFDETAQAAREDAERTGATLVPPFDHPAVIAGQGTVARELIGQLHTSYDAMPDVVVVPVGGGGLLAGTLAWLSERHREIKVIGVEPEGAASLTAARAAGGPVRLDEVDTFVDGAAVGQVGEIPWQVISSRVDAVVTVPEGLVCMEMIDLYQSDGIIAEPAGALASAAVRAGLDLPPGSRVACILSGGNNDLSRYAEVVERALVHEGLKHYFLVEFPQEPGALRRFLDEVLGPDDDITLFEYVKRSNRDVGPALVGVEMGEAGDLEPLLQRMAESPLQVTRLPPDSPLARFVI